MTFIEQEFSSRKVSVPSPLESPEGISETVQVPQVELSGDTAADLQSCVELLGDMESLAEAVNSAKVSQARSEWNAEHTISVEDGSAIKIIRDQVGTFTQMGMSEEQAVRMVVAIPNVFAACLLDGIDPKPALTEEQFETLSAQADEFKAIVLAAREKAAQEKAEREASGKKRGRPKQS